MPVPFKNRVVPFFLWAVVLGTSPTLSWQASTTGSGSGTGTGTDVAPGQQVIQIGGLLPKDPKRMFSIGRMSPAAELALERVRKNGILNDAYTLTISYRDSKCSEAVGMNEAINFFIQRDVHAFFGPVCDYAAAPVARQTHFWNLPMVSVGTIAPDFANRRKTVYPLLTRAGTASVHPLGDTFVAIMRSQSWTKIKVLYDKSAYDHVLTHVCIFAVEAIINQVKKVNLTRDYYDMGAVPNTEHVLRNEIGNSYAGEGFYYCFSTTTRYVGHVRGRCGAAIPGYGAGMVPEKNVSRFYIMLT